MLIALSADAVARRVMSGENFRHVIPRAWARGMVKRGAKVRDLGFSRGRERSGDAEGSREAD